VKQCEHCRGARKSKSHHAKCDCGEKKDKDKHKDKGAAKSEHMVNVSVDDVSNHAAVNGNRCGCHSGAKCLCGVKKDSIDLKLDTSKLTLHAARAKPKLVATHSESTLTVFANGHHKPCHRNNNTAHVSGAPYKINRPHTLHGSAAFASYTHSKPVAPVAASAQRAMDTLSLSNNDFYTMFGSAQRPVDSQPITPLTGTIEPSGVQDTLFSSQLQTAAYSQDNNSPIEASLGDTFSNQQWPWTTSIPPLNRNFTYGSLSTSPSQDCLPNLEADWPIPSAGLTNPLWSAGDLPLDPSKLNDALTQPISHSGESNKQSSAGLTTASSSHSETGEPVWYGDLDIKKPQSTGGDTLFWEDNPVFRFATAAQSEPALTQSLTPPYDEIAPSTKLFDELSAAMGAAGSGDKATFFSATDLNDTCAIAMPNNVNEMPATNSWGLVDQNSIFEEPAYFDPPFQGWI
jgi:hypothetical protein